MTGTIEPQGGAAKGRPGAEPEAERLEPTKNGGSAGVLPNQDANPSQRSRSNELVRPIPTDDWQPSSRNRRGRIRSAGNGAGAGSTNGATPDRSTSRSKATGRWKHFLHGVDRVLDIADELTIKVVRLILSGLVVLTLAHVLSTILWVSRITPMPGDHAYATVFTVGLNGALALFVLSELSETTRHKVASHEYSRLFRYVFYLVIIVVLSIVRHVLSMSVSAELSSDSGDTEAWLISLVVQVVNVAMILVLVYAAKLLGTSEVAHPGGKKAGGRGKG